MSEETIGPIAYLIFILLVIWLIGWAQAKKKADAADKAANQEIESRRKE